MNKNEIWKVEGAGSQEAGEGLGIKAPEDLKCKRFLKSVIAAACLMLTCFLVGDLPAASAECRRVRRCRYVVKRPVVVERPVMVTQRCVEYRPVVYERCYEPCPRKIVRKYNYYVAPRVVVKRRPVTVCEDQPYRERVVYVDPGCDDRWVIYDDDMCY